MTAILWPCPGCEHCRRRIAGEHNRADMPAGRRVDLDRDQRRALVWVLVGERAHRIIPERIQLGGPAAQK